MNKFALTLLAGCVTGFAYAVILRMASDAKYERNLRQAHTCASCDGSETELAPDPETGFLVCKDRTLCRETMIYKNMLEATE